MLGRGRDIHYKYSCFYNRLFCRVSHTVSSICTWPFTSADMDTRPFSGVSHMQSVLFFCQGVDYDIDSMVQEASAQAFESLFVLCRCCGELALATEMTMATLIPSSSAEESHIRV